MDTLLEVAAIFVQPDWSALLALFPVLLALLFIAWFAWTVRRFATLGPARRAPARIQPITPAHVHMPGGSSSPILVAFGAGALFLGLVAPAISPTWGPLVLGLGVTVLVITLLVWFREAMRDYDHLEVAQRLPAVVHQGPPPGVHMPGPSIRPLLGALGSAALLGGLVIGGWVLILAVVFLVYTLIGWLVDFTAEYRKVEEADKTGHLENIPNRALPTRTLQVFAVLFALVGMWQLGIFPPASAGGTGEPGASGAPSRADRAARRAHGRGEDHRLRREGALRHRRPARSRSSCGTRTHRRRSTTSTFDPPTASQTLKDQPTTDGGAVATYQYEPLDAGTYQFICSVHPIPAMTGTLTVE